MHYIPLTDKIINALKKSERANVIGAKNAADIDYIAMMTDVELDTSDELEEGEEEEEEE